MDNLEVFEQNYIELDGIEPELHSPLTHPGSPPTGKGWFYWYCHPGCLPDTEAVGPFATEADAFEDATEKEIFGD